jgi:hypothetical protein
MKKSILYLGLLFFVLVSINSKASEFDQRIILNQTLFDHQCSSEDIMRPANSEIPTSLSDHYFQKNIVWSKQNKLFGDIYIPEVIIATMLDNTKLRYTFTYDEEGNKLTELIEMNPFGKWENLRYNQFFYNDKNEEFEYIGQIWDNDKWENDRKHIYEYEGNRRSTIYYFWESGSWILESRDIIEQSENEQGKIYIWLTQNWIDGQWVNTWRETTQYIDAENMELYIQQEWVEDKWINTEKGTQYFDDNENMIQYTIEKWENDEWVYNRQYIRDHNDNNQKTKELVQYWKNDTWEDTQQILYNYSNDGYLEEELTQDLQNEKWENDLQRTYTNDLHGNKVLIVNKKWNNGAWIDANDYFFFEDSMGYFHFYAGYMLEISFMTLSSAEDIEKNGITLSCSPNPVLSEFKISYSTDLIGDLSISIYNSNGEIIADLISGGSCNSGEILFNTTDLPSGAYYCVLKSGDKKVIRSFVVVR